MTKISGQSVPNQQQRIGNPPPQLQTGDRTHTVSRGDTLTHIARQNGISTRDLIQANPQISNPDRIWPGDQVRIPTQNTPTATPAQTAPTQTPAQTAPTQTPAQNTTAPAPTQPHQNDSYSTGGGPNVLPSPAQRPNQTSVQTPDRSGVNFLTGSARPDGHGGGDLRGSLMTMGDPNGMHVSVGEGRLGGAAQINEQRVNLSARADVTGIKSTTGDSNLFDIGSKIGDAGGEATFHIERDGSAGRIGAGYRANIAEVNAGVGSVSNQSTSDFRQEARISAGAPSGGVFVSWNDRDNDGAKNYRLDIDVPIPGTPLGVGVSYETERPVRDGLAVLGTLNPITAPIAGGYLLGRMFKLW
jgi:LysM repeat protein